MNSETKIKEAEKLSLEHCKKVLNQDGLNFDDKEIIMIRDFLYAMAMIDYSNFMEEILKNKLSNQNQNNDEQSSDSLHPCQHRRAS